MSNWVLVLLLTAAVLAVPLAILLGASRPTWPVFVSGSASLIASAVLWIVRGGFSDVETQTDAIIGLMIFIGSIVLLIATWALALNAAAQSRRWWWFALLTLAGPLSIAANLIIIRPDPCMFAHGQNGSPYLPYCGPPNPFILTLLVAGFLVGPVTAMLSSLRAFSLQRTGPPVGPNVAPLAAIQTASDTRTDPL